ncbi:MAG TPA: bifunctional nuclease domain-containing protein, partial [Chloroflexota bacterium]|nr:bifunctional nuclease domain-containing protein [Chloroflexota bacterium]
MEAVDTLVRSAQRGDTGAFVCLIERVEPGLRRFCVRLAGETGADDLAQEALLRAFRGLSGLKQPERFEAWLFAIAANLARRWWRQQLRWPLSLESLAAVYPDMPASTWEIIAPPAAAVDMVFEETEQARALQAALDSLPASLSQVVALHYLEGLNYQEVATVLEVPVSTVRGRLFKSRQRLQKTLLDAGFTERRQSRKKGSTSVASSKRPPHAQNVPAQTEEEVIIDSIRMNVMAPSRVVFLKSKTRERFVPIIIGNPEADAIAIALQGKQVPRPLTHDLMLRGFGELGANVTRVVVSGLEGETFLAQIHVDTRDRPTVLDARPSDSLALAVRAGAPIFVAAAVMERSGIETVEYTESGAVLVPAQLRPTERVQKVMVLAHQEMARFGRDQIGAEHALLGLLVERQSIAAQALAAADVELGAVRTAVAVRCGFGDKTAPKTVPAEPANPKLQELIQ